MEVIRFCMRLVPWLTLLLLAVGCCHHHQGPTSPVVEGFSKALRPGDIVETKTGAVIPFETLLAELAGAQVIYVGETHTSMADHRIQLRVAEGLYARNAKLILAMEMFPRNLQPLLDEYSKGAMTEQTLHDKSDWKNVWGYPFQLYQPLLAWARQQPVKVVGLNAPPTVVRKVGQNGIVSLTPEERSQIAATIDFDDAAHRAYLKQGFDLHPRGGIRDFESFYEAQLSWEETMAETLAELLTGMDQGGQVLVLIGKGHIAHGFGVPERVDKRAPHPFRTILPIPVDALDGPPGPDLADYVWITEKSTVFQHRGRLGIMVKPAATQGLEVMGVVPDSPAAKAGIMPGDVIVSLDGASINSVEDLHQAFLQKKGQSHRTVIERGAQRIELELTVAGEE